jgi:hypothetical protein
LSAATLSAAMAVGAAAMAADLPKEGTFSVTWSGAATFKATAIGKERLVFAWDENSLAVGTGLFDHMTWHCFGLGDIANGMAQWNGYCVGTDTAGDQIAANVASDGKYAADAKSFPGLATLTTGTGKYAGISGSWKYVGHGPEFRTAAEGTYVEYGNLQGSYKLP